MLELESSISQNIFFRGRFFNFSSLGWLKRCPRQLYMLLLVKGILNSVTPKACQLPENSDAVSKEAKIRIPQRDLPPPKKENHLFAGRVGKVAHVMAQFCRAKVELPHGKEDSTVIMESVLEEDKICSAVDTNGDNVQVTFPGEIIVEGTLMQM